MSELNQNLYQAMLLEHNKKPRNFKKLDAPTHTGEGFNPLCGDHYWIYLAMDAAQRINQVSFEGRGCAISKASASIMTDLITGKSKEEALQAFEAFRKLLAGDASATLAKPELKKLSIFSGIWQYPARVKCAALAWHAMKGAMGNEPTVSTES